MRRPDFIGVSLRFRRDDVSPGRPGQLVNKKRKSPEYQKNFRGYMTIYIVVTLMVFIALIAYSARKKM